MLVSENQQAKYAVSMFLATAGAGGNLLGSDEKEIIYLVFGIIDLQNKEVSKHIDETMYLCSIVQYKIPI